MGKAELGEKLLCASCGARYYDLNKVPALCPKCGAENERPKTFKAKKTETPAAKPAADKPAEKSSDAEAVEDIEDIEAADDDDDLIDDDTDLDDDDDDVGGVIGPIDSDDDTAS